MTQTDRPAGERDELVALLGHQRTLYRRLGILAERQQSLIVQDDARPLLELLGERQKLVDELTGLGQRLAPYRSRWAEVYHGLDEPTRREVSAMLEEANTMLGTILGSDGRDCATLAARRESMSQRISQCNTVERAHAAYASAGISTGVGRLADAEG